MNVSHIVDKRSSNGERFQRRTVEIEPRSLHQQLGHQNVPLTVIDKEHKVDLMKESMKRSTSKEKK